MCKLVSIIVPVYNVAPFLVDCVESLKHQTYHNLEIILIDDGSTDSSGDICDALQHTDNRIKSFHKINGGVSSARNYGIEKATGAYQMFVDGDDWIDINAVEVLVAHLKRTESDICFCSKYYKNKSQIQIATHLRGGSNLFSACEIEHLHLRYGFISSPCLSVAVRNKVLDVRFKEDIHTLEDWEYNFQILMSVENISILDVPYYHYRTVLGSASKSPLNSRKLSCFKIIEAVNNEIIKQKQEHQFKDDKKNIPAFLIYHMLVAYANNGAIENADKQLRKYAQHYLPMVLSSATVNMKSKIYVLIACASLKIFKVLYNLKNRKI